jgi:hypothetical protein
MPEIVVMVLPVCLERERLDTDGAVRQVPKHKREQRERESKTKEHKREQRERESDAKKKETTKTTT